jgi:hypothetical protein
MKIRSAKSFRLWYKTKVKELEWNDARYNENFVGTYHKVSGKKTIKGFFEMYHGDKPDIASYLPSILKIAEDGQAIYEFLQNAVDCGSTHFYIFYDENYFLAINNGNPFDTEGLQSILNIAQTTKKDPDKIGRFGIGFKLAHRLVGKNEGTDELVRLYKGPILFSWAKLEDLESLMNNEPIEPIAPKKGINNGFYDAPYLLKLLLTNFPSDPNETIKDIDYVDKILFPKEELNELVTFLNKNFENHSDSLKKNVLKQGSLFFIKLGEDKKKLLDKDFSELVNGIQYSMNTLKNLQKVYINNEDIGKIPLQLEAGVIKKKSEEFERISPEYKEFDIKFAIGFNMIKFGNEKAYLQIKLLKEKPNFYKYFPMGDEINGFAFIVHCDSFSNEANRRKLHEDDINKNLFPVLAKHITQRISEYKINDKTLFLNLYASVLLSDIPERQNNKWLRPIFYDILLDVLQNNIPTKTGFSNTPNNVKINKLKLKLDLSDFGLGHIHWFEWDNEADRFLIDEAVKSEKLGIEEWDIRDIIENANLDRINNWISACDVNLYKAFISEIEKSVRLRKETKEKICQIKLYRFSNGIFYSFNEIIQKQIIQNKPIFNYGHSNLFFKTHKTEQIVNELDKLEIYITELNISEYPNIFSSVEKMPDEKQIYLHISERCKSNILTANEKKNLFLNLINEDTKFDNVDDASLKVIQLFCDSNSIIQPLNRLVDCKLNTAVWINDYKLKNEEFFNELMPYLVSEQDAIFKEIYLPEQELILEKLTEANEIKSLIKLYQDNQKHFFKELIIIKNEHSFSITNKTINTYQVQSGDPEVRNFISKNCSSNLFVLPQDFFIYKEDEGIVKADELYTLILDFVDVNSHKENLISIVRYNAKYNFLQKLSEFKFKASQTYNIEDYEYKVLDLICNIFKENDFQLFRDKLVIETDVQNFKLSEIPPIKDKIKIGTKDFSLSEILPLTYQNNNLISDLIAQFSSKGLPSDKLSALFGLDEEIDINNIFIKFLEQTEILQNPEQFFFLIYYDKYIANIDLSKLGFDITCAVFPSDFALEAEKLPEYLHEWITQKKVVISNLETVGIYTENTTLISLRKFFLTQSEFDLINIAKEERLSDGKMLLKTLELLKEKRVELKNESQFAVFKEIVRVINTGRIKGQELIMQEEFNFDLLEQLSTEWKSVGDFSIYLYNGPLPKIVKINEIQDYIFYQYNNSDYAVNEKKIYIDENTDKTKTLSKVALDENNNFTSEDSKDIELSIVKAKLEEYQNLDQENQNNSNSIFLDDINDFIAELEDSEWSEFIPELKSLLELSINQSQEKQKLYNLIAKLKLSKETKIQFEIADKDYNHLENGEEKYFVHSARGAFAYIHPNEILKMKNDGYKMALDFNTKSRIKIYNTAEEILSLNTNHILAYQNEKSFDDLFSFCEANRDAKKHLLIIDKDNSGEKSLALLKLLNNEDDYR